MNETYFVIQYRLVAQDNWRDDSARLDTRAQADARLEKARGAKIYRGAQWRIVQRTDSPV